VQPGDAVVIADHDLRETDRVALGRASAVVLLATVMPPLLERAHVVLPVANHAEEEGTFTNLRGRVQRFLQAKAAPGLARPGWFVLADLLALLGEPVDATRASEVFTLLAGTNPEFAGLSHDAIGLRGGLVAGATVPAGAAT
jgi:predicted molibdopterin-dependent oxidoreductase YjgC